MTSETTKKLSVLTIQCGAVDPDPKVNVPALISFLREATKDRTPDFVVFTELATTQYFCGYNDPKWFDVAEPIDGQAVTAFRAEAKRMGCYILLPFYERSKVKGEFFNSLAVIGPDGELI
ncbi:MAG: carbon-nitrogen hydrolase family protein, partial [Mesorhizobium sp.]|nr:carbon-nitrogen hydrolase family protein [Mesorhizobium sp.]